MDPTATLKEILSLLHIASCATESDTARIYARQGAVEELEHLSAWLIRGGFSPDVVTAIEQSGVVDD